MISLKLRSSRYDMVLGVSVGERIKGGGDLTARFAL